MSEPATHYVRPLRRIAVRCRKKNGQWAFGVLLSTVTAPEALVQAGPLTAQEADEAAVLLACVRFYDRRGGTIELSYVELR